MVNKSRQKKTKSCLRGRCTDGLWKFDVGLFICSPKHPPGSTYFWATLALIMSFQVSAAYVNVSINRAKQKIMGAGQKRAKTQARRRLKQRMTEGWSEKEEIGARGNAASCFLLFSSTVIYLFHSSFILFVKFNAQYFVFVFFCQLL